MADEPVTDQERWAEQEAKQFERSAEYLRDELIPGWIERVTKNPHPENAKALYEATLRMKDWQDAASALRKPRYLRIERESYDRTTGGQ